MAPSQQNIESAFRRSKWAALILDLRRSWFMWAFVITLVTGFAYYNATPERFVQTLQGRAEAVGQPATEDNSAPVIAVVRLETGETINVPLPRGELFRHGSRMEVEVIEREWPPRSDRYRFIRYIE